MGQETAGNIRGTVKDANGAAIPNATVTATNPQRTWTTTTDDQRRVSVSAAAPAPVCGKRRRWRSFSKASGKTSVELGRTLQVNLDLKC